MWMDGGRRIGTTPRKARSSAGMQILSITPIVLCLSAATALVQAAKLGQDWWSLQPLGEFDRDGSIDRLVTRALVEK